MTPSVSDLTSTISFAAMLPTSERFSETGWLFASTAMTDTAKPPKPAPPAFLPQPETSAAPRQNKMARNEIFFMRMVVRVSVGFCEPLLHVIISRRVQPHRHRALPMHRLADEPVTFVVRLVHQRLVELGLAGKVIVERRLGHARVAHDVRDGRRRVAAMGETLERGAQNLLPCFPVGCS